MPEEKKNQEEVLSPEEEQQLKENKERHDKYKVGFKSTANRIIDAADNNGLKSAVLLVSFDDNTTISSIGGNGNDIANTLFTIFNQYPQLKALMAQTIIAHDSMIQQQETDDKDNKSPIMGIDGKPISVKKVVGEKEPHNQEAAKIPPPKPLKKV